MDWRKIPFPERKALLECVSSAGAEISVSDGCFRLFFSGEHGVQIKAAVLDSRLDEIFAKGEVLRHSSQSYRIVTSVKTRLEEIPGEIFIKKIHRCHTVSGFMKNISTGKKRMAGDKRITAG